MDFKLFKKLIIFSIWNFNSFQILHRQYQKLQELPVMPNFRHCLVRAYDRDHLRKVITCQQRPLWRPPNLIYDISWPVNSDYLSNTIDDHLNEKEDKNLSTELSNLEIIRCATRPLNVKHVKLKFLCGPKYWLKNKNIVPGTQI